MGNKLVINSASASSAHESLREELWNNWVNTYVASVIPGMGRPGAVCPCAPTILRTQSMQISHLRSSDVASACDEILNYGLQFIQRFASQRRNSRDCHAILINDDTSAARELYQIHFELKPWFITRGMALGEFFPKNTRSSVRSDAITPLASPVHALVIRHVTHHDLMFVESDLRYDNGTREKMQTAIRSLLDAL